MNPQNYLDLNKLDPTAFKPQTTPQNGFSPQSVLSGYKMSPIKLKTPNQVVTQKQVSSNPVAIPTYNYQQKAIQPPPQEPFTGGNQHPLGGIPTPDQQQESLRSAQSIQPQVQPNPYPTYNAPSDSANQSLINQIRGLSGQSEEEKVYQQKLTNIDANLSKSNLVEELNRPGYRSTYTAGVNENQRLAGIDRSSYSDALNSLQNARTGQLSTLSNVANLQQSNYNSQVDRAKTEYDNLVKAYTAKQPKTQEVSAGSSLINVNPDGTTKEIYKGQPVKTNASGTGDIAEFTFRQSLSPEQQAQFDAYQKQAANLKNVNTGLTPYQQASLALRQDNQSKLSNAQEEKVADIDTYISFANEILRQYEKNGQSLPGVSSYGGGSIGGVINSLSGGFFEGGENQSNRELVSNLNSQLALARGGKTFTPTEKALIEKFSPTINDTDSTIASKLTNLVRQLETSKSNLISNAVGEGYKSNNQAQGNQGQGSEYNNYLKSIGQTTQ